MSLSLFHILLLNFQQSPYVSCHLVGLEPQKVNDSNHFNQKKLTHLQWLSPKCDACCLVHAPQNWCTQKISAEAIPI